MSGRVETFLFRITCLLFLFFFFRMHHLSPPYSFLCTHRYFSFLSLPSSPLTLVLFSSHLGPSFILSVLQPLPISPLHRHPSKTGRKHTRLSPQEERQVFSLSLSQQQQLRIQQHTLTYTGTLSPPHLRNITMNHPHSPISLTCRKQPSLSQWTPTHPKMRFGLSSLFLIWLCLTLLFATAHTGADIIRPNGVETEGQFDIYDSKSNTWAARQ